MRRTYISRARRDGDATGRAAIYDGRPARRLGRLACEQGTPRWANPFVAEKARQWTAGYNLAHLTAVGGVCRGCALCGPAGTRSVK